MGMMSIRAAQHDSSDILTTTMLWWLAGVIAVNVAAAAVTMGIGIRHFNRLQF